MKRESRLKKLRSKRNLTQRELSDASGVPLKVVRELERGERRADVKYVLALADYFSISVEALMSPWNGGDRR